MTSAEGSSSGCSQTHPPPKPAATTILWILYCSVVSIVSWQVTAQTAASFDTKERTAILNLLQFKIQMKAP